MGCTAKASLLSLALLVASFAGAGWAAENNVQESAQEDMSPIIVDHLAPNFEGEAYVDGSVKRVKLSDFKGKWILLCFYPGDFTYVCATEVAGVIEGYRRLEDIGVKAVAVSEDSLHSHKVWVETSPAITDALQKTNRKFPPFPMVSDQTHVIAKLYGVYDPDAGVATRGRFIIDPDFYVRGYEVLNATVGRNLDETYRQVQAFQFVRDTGLVTPAGWQPGEPGIAPTIENAGRIKMLLPAIEGP